MKKRAISAVLALLMLLCSVPLALAEDSVPEEAKYKFPSVEYAFRDTYLFMQNLPADGNADDHTAFMYSRRFLGQMDYFAKYHFNNGKDEIDSDYYELPYKEYIALVDSLFANHSDMKEYLKNGDLSRYDEETDTVWINMIGGWGDSTTRLPLDSYRVGGVTYVIGPVIEWAINEETFGDQEFGFGKLEGIQDDRGNDVKAEVIGAAVMSFKYDDGRFKILSCANSDYYILDNVLYDLKEHKKYNRITFELAKVNPVTGGEQIVEDNGTEIVVDSLKSYPYTEGYWAAEGQSFTFTVKKTDGVKDASVYYYDGNTDVSELGDDRYVVENMTGPTVIGVRAQDNDVIEPVDSTELFKDISAGSWYAPYVDYSLSYGLMKGVGDDSFAPDEAMTRAMLVTVLWRIAGEPVSQSEAHFSDLTQDWYRAPVAWASENGIVLGTSDDTFSPDSSVTREQMAAILYRYCKAANIDIYGRTELSAFPDSTQVSAWAEEALSWAVAEGLITGSDIGGVLYLSPASGATRAQVATILMRFCEKY